MIRKYLHTVVFLFCAVVLLGQDVIPANTMVSTNYRNKDYSLKENSTSIFYNSVSKEFFIVVDFSKFQNNLDSINNWLADLIDAPLIYKATINSDNLLLLTANNSKTYNIEGRIKFNNVVSNKQLQLIMFEITKDGVLYRNNNNDYYDRIRCTFEFTISPNDFKVNKKMHHLTQPIVIKVENGYVNEYKPGMEDWLGGNF